MGPVARLPRRAVDSRHQGTRPGAPSGARRIRREVAVRRIHRFTSAVLIAALAGPLWAAAPAFAAPYTRLQVLLPGESPAPGTPSGKSGTARAQTAGVPFAITVRACDASWNLVTSVTNVIEILSTDGSA